jgi:hypothetical protein
MMMMIDVSGFFLPFASPAGNYEPKIVRSSAAAFFDTTAGSRAVRKVNKRQPFDYLDYIKEVEGVKQCHGPVVVRPLCLRDEAILNFERQRENRNEG